MNQVTSSITDKVLSLYKEPWRYVKTLSVSYPDMEGICEVDTTQYTNEDLRHVTGIEAQAIINQMGYVAFAQWMTDGTLDPRLSMTKFLLYMKEHMFLRETKTTINFRSTIEKNTPFTVKGRVSNIRKNREIWFAFVDYDFDDGSALASMKFALDMSIR